MLLLRRLPDLLRDDKTDDQKRPHEHHLRRLVGMVHDLVLAALAR